MYRRLSRRRYAKRPTRRFARRSAARTSYRRKAQMKKLTRRTSSRRVLNLTSVKKRDTMLTLTNVLADRTRPATYTANDAFIAGGTTTPYVFAWCPTARVNDTGSGKGTRYETATRSSNVCYMRGLSERIELQSSTGNPWQWRRILFTTKGFVSTVAQSSNFYLSNLTSNGYRRTVNEIYGSNLIILYDLLFSGSQGTDWDDPMIARVDTSRVTLLYDKVRTFSSGNQYGMVKRFKFWHPFNKNLVYNDDEVGGGEFGASVSTFGKPGMGDVLVIDVIKAGGSSASTDLLSFRPNSTLYWHEK
uniref:Capsid protein n=1 Tax=Carpodacus roseus Genomoviridae sp. TaxID=2814939 RepID=A0A8E7G1S0_9VIRU|nr:MAG: capsid protein [Gemykibivirus]